MSMCFFFFFNDTATTEIYTLSLHDALPISRDRSGDAVALARGADDDDHERADRREPEPLPKLAQPLRDRKSTRLNSSHGYISYAVFCLKKKNTYIRLRRSQRLHVRLHEYSH